MQKNTLDIDLSGKVAVVTGAGGVLCSDMARALARAGAWVALLNRTAAKAQVHAGAINAAGGVAGFMNSNTTLEACSSTGSVTATGTGDVSVGGVVGYISAGAKVTACYATGNVTGTGTGTGSIYVGGVTGDNASGTLTACYHAKGTVSGPDGATGGVTGRNYNALGDPVITACYWKNDQDEGIGYNQAGTTVETTKVDGDWTDAVAKMNKALSGTGYSYQQGNPPKLN